jgi:hypothetical protein
MIISIDNNNFYRKNNILEKDEKEKILQDVDYELKHNPCNEVPSYQTYSDLYFKYKNTSHWSKLYKTILFSIKEKIEGDYTLHKAWANLSKENNNFQFHIHDVDLTCVYYLKNKYPEYGTKLENNIIIEAIENSILFFNGGIPHSITNMPSEIAKNNSRYSVVFDFKKI